MVVVVGVLLGCCGWFVVVGFERCLKRKKERKKESRSFFHYRQIVSIVIYIWNRSPLWRHPIYLLELLTVTKRTLSPTNKIRAHEHIISFTVMALFD